LVFQEIGDEFRFLDDASNFLEDVLVGVLVGFFEEAAEEIEKFLLVGLAAGPLLDGFELVEPVKQVNVVEVVGGAQSFDTGAEGALVVGDDGEG
jgi:hypothetical protein